MNFKVNAFEWKVSILDAISEMAFVPNSSWIINRLIILKQLAAWFSPVVMSAQMTDNQSGAEKTMHEVVFQIQDGGGFSANQEPN